MAKPMRCDIDLDWCTYTCPCGQIICTRHMQTADIVAWINQHKPHTNGKCLEVTTADGARVWATPPPPKLTNL